MMHAYHEALPGYEPEQILHDGCPECKRRGANVEIALAYMDRPTFHRAWLRAKMFDSDGLTNVSNAETKLLQVLAQIRHQLSSLVLGGVDQS